MERLQQQQKAGPFRRPYAPTSSPLRLVAPSDKKAKSMEQQQRQLQQALASFNMRGALINVVVIMVSYQYLAKLCAFYFTRFLTCVADLMALSLRVYVDAFCSSQS
jgi:hypothetical protein